MRTQHCSLHCLYRIYLITERVFLFPVGISPCPVWLSAIESQLALRSSKDGHQDVASALYTDDIGRQIT